MKFTASDAWPLLKESFSEWSDDHATRHSAALAYYTIFSLAPLLIIVVTVASFLWPESGAAKAQLMQQITELIGPDSAEFVQQLLDNAQQPGSGGVFATIIGIVTLLVGATAAFAQLQDSLNAVWEVKPAPDYGFKALIMARVLSFGLILTVGFLLLVSLVLTVAISALSALVGGGGALEPLWQAVNFVVSFAIITALFAAMYRYLPDAEIAWRDTWVGAGVTAFLFVVGKLGIGLYLGSSGVASTYGAAGSLVILLLWIYYSALILFFGAEVTQVFARRYGQGITPSKHAVRVVEKTEEVGPEAAAALRKTPGEKIETSTTLPARRTRRPSLAQRALPFAAAFVVGRLTKKPKVQIVKRFIRR